MPGPNKIRFDYLSPRASHTTIHPTSISINYLPLQNIPPLQLAIIIAKDSECQFPTTPGEDLADGTDLGTAVRKLRMAAYLWQAFTGEQMYQNNFGRRCFRYDEEWQPGTLSARDIDSGQMRSEAKVHIIRCNETVAELSALKCVGQNQDGISRDSEVCGLLEETVRKHFNLQPGQKQYVSAVLLDSFWNTEMESLRGGGSALSMLGDSLKLSLVSAPAIADYPSCIEEVVPALIDFKSLRVDSVTNSRDEHVTAAETMVSKLMGAHLRLTYQLFGCPDPANGTTRGESLRLDRALIAGDHSQHKTEAQNGNALPQVADMSWPRRDIIRFRFHPSFRLPSDGPVSDERIHAWPVDNGKVIIVSPSGIAFVEIFVDDDNLCRGYLEYVNADAGNCGIPKQVTLTEHGLRHSLSESSKKSKRLKVVVYSGGLCAHTIDDFSQAAKSKQSAVKLPNGQPGYRGSLIGASQRPHSSPTELILDSAVVQTKLLVSLKVHFDMVMFVTGIEFCYEDSTSQLFGRKTGEHANGEFMLGMIDPNNYHYYPQNREEFDTDLAAVLRTAIDTRRGEILMGFHLKFGAVVEGIEILTSLGRKSGVFGRATNGQG
jgi:hypothetical protein